MPGSMDDRQVHMVNVTEETILTVMVYPDGRTVTLSKQPKGVVAHLLRQLADTFVPTVADPVVPPTIEQIEVARVQIDEMIRELRGVEPATTEQLVSSLGGNTIGLSEADHRLMLATTAAVLLQRAAYS